MHPGLDDDDEFFDGLGHANKLAYLHGMWRDEIRGSTFCVRVRGESVATVYCSGGDHELTGTVDWRYRRGQFVGRYRWLARPISGMFVLQPDTRDRLLGGWWYARDLAGKPLDHLPFLPGVHPCRWIRQDPRRPWPRWATRGLDLPDDPPATSETLAGPAERVDARTAEGRYRLRVARWTADRAGLDRLAARLGHRGWWLLHNLVVHPLLGLAQGRLPLRLHDWTGRRLDRDDAPRAAPPPRIERRLWWLVHNLLAHPAIALAPCAATFRWHDATARRMAVPGWA